MVGVHQFAYGWITPVLAYALSVIGSMLGLTATVRARAAASTGLRARWLALAAFAIGGTGIWTMHFLAMLGFTVDGTPLRYDVPITVASWLTAVIVVGIGLFVVGFPGGRPRPDGTPRRPSAIRVISAGLLTGIGVASMHYSGMAAMRLNGDVGYDRRYVAASVVIAVVACTVALWFTVSVRRPLAVFGSAALMGVAICGMHFTGMFGLRVHVHSSPADVQGVDPMSFLIPMLVLVLVVIVALFYALLAVPGQSDEEVQAELRARIDGSHPDTRPARYTDTLIQSGFAEPTQPSGAFAGQSARSGYPGQGGGVFPVGGFGGGYGQPAEHRTRTGEPPRQRPHARGEQPPARY